MVNNRYILFSMDDDRIKNLAGVLGNKTCESIIDYLEKKDEGSAKDISDALKLPMNTIDYNIKKLVDSGIVEKKKKFFWSVKGKKIVLYGLSNKSIIISPKKNKVSSKLKSLVPAVLSVGLVTLLLKIFTKPKVIEEIPEVLGTNPEMPMKIAEYGVQSAGEIARDTVVNNINIVTETARYNPFWTWFLAGALVALFIFSILNWRKL